MTDTNRIRRALISVSDKSGLADLAKALESFGIEIISTGGTMKFLRDAGLHVISVSTFTGSPEVMGGRVKTLHPKIHGGILYRRNDPDDVAQLDQLDSKSIDLIVVNLYPFQQTVAKKGSTDAEIIENIDIGGPSMLRSGAKNHESVTVIVDPLDYPSLIDQLREHNGSTTFDFRRACAGKVFALTAVYDTAIADYFARGQQPKAVEKFPDKLQINLKRVTSLRYGENPHQDAALYADSAYNGVSLVHAAVLSGKELSYNNYNDLEACLDMLLDFDEPFATVVKHSNPCGAAIGKDIAQAYKLAYESDPLSAFGSIIGLNRHIDIACATLLHETEFVECILAPSFADDALAMLKKKKTRRLLALPEIASGRAPHLPLKQLRGGMLAQTEDIKATLPIDCKAVTKRQPTPDELRELLFAWKVVKHVKSNAIVLTKGGATVGIGMGQTSRVDSAFLAVKRAGDRAKGAVCASDAFFPMPDGVETVTNAGVTAIIQPGGSKGDDDAIAATDKAGAAMVFTGTRHFKH